MGVNPLHARDDRQNAELVNEVSDIPADGCPPRVRGHRVVGVGCGEGAVLVERGISREVGPATNRGEPVDRLVPGDRPPAIVSPMIEDGFVTTGFEVGRVNIRSFSCVTRNKGRSLEGSAELSQFSVSKERSLRHPPVAVLVSSPTELAERS